MRKTKAKASLATAYRYKKKGHDVTTNGKIDPKKVQEVFDGKRDEENKKKPDEKGKFWDTEFRKERALKLIREREIREGIFIRKDEIVAEVIRRETEIKKAIMALGKAIAPKLVKQRTAVIQRMINEAHAKIFNRLARRL